MPYYTTDTYTTGDGATVTNGDRVYNFYDMQPGTIGEDAGLGWFRFLPDPLCNAQSTILDGSRIVTIAHAARMGWPNAA